MRASVKNRSVRVDPSRTAAIAIVGVCLLIGGSTSARADIVAAVLPSSRSIDVTQQATAFATLINTGEEPAEDCFIAPKTDQPVEFSYQPTRTSDNAPIGVPDAPVDIPPGTAQSFLLRLQPQATFAPTLVEFTFKCASGAPAQVVAGINTLLLSSNDESVADVIALALTIPSPPALRSDGIVYLPGVGQPDAFAVAAYNLGSSDTLTVSATSHSPDLALDISLCESNPVTSACIGPPTTEIAKAIGANETPTFVAFVSARGDFPFDVVKHRIAVEFRDAAGIVRGSTSVAVRLAPTGAPYTLSGLNFGPYLELNEDPNLGAVIGEERVRKLLKVVASHTFWVRSFGVTGGLEHVGPIAHELGLKHALGTWISGDLSANEQALSAAIEAARAGHADLVIVGSETMLRRDVPEATLIDYITRVKAALPGVLVTTADVYGELLSRPALLDAVDVVLANFYPYWEGVSIEQAMVVVHDQHTKLANAAPGKPVIVSESGWPSCGDVVGDAVPSNENAVSYLLNFVSWARTNRVMYFYFEAFDELWKERYEGPQGACWGLWDSALRLKDGVQRVFDGETTPDSWSTATQ